MSFDSSTLKYKEKSSEQCFFVHIGPHSLLIVEPILLLIYIYLSIKKNHQY